MKHHKVLDKENTTFNEKPLIICKTPQMLMKSNVFWKKNLIAKRILNQSNQTPEANICVCSKTSNPIEKARLPAQAIAIPINTTKTYKTSTNNNKNKKLQTNNKQLTNNNNNNLILGPTRSPQCKGLHSTKVSTPTLWGELWTMRKLVLTLTQLSRPITWGHHTFVEPGRPRQTTRCHG